MAESTDRWRQSQSSASPKPSLDWANDAFRTWRTSASSFQTVLSSWHGSFGSNWRDWRCQDQARLSPHLAWTGTLGVELWIAVFFCSFSCLCRSINIVSGYSACQKLRSWIRSSLLSSGRWPKAVAKLVFCSANFSESVLLSEWNLTTLFLSCFALQFLSRESWPQSQRPSCFWNLNRPSSHQYLKKGLLCLTDAASSLATYLD